MLSQPMIIRFMTCETILNLFLRMKHFNTKTLLGDRHLMDHLVTFEPIILDISVL